MSKPSAIHAAGVSLAAFALVACGGAPPSGPAPAPLAPISAPVTEAPVAPVEPPRPAFVPGEILAELAAGSTKIVVEECPFDVPPPKGKSDPLTSIAVAKDHLYAANGSAEVFAYRIEPGCKLTRDKGVGADGAIKLPGDVQTVSAATTGAVLASHGIFAAHFVRDGAAGAPCGEKNAVLHSSGAWGVSFFHATDPVRLVVGKGACTTEPWFLGGMGDASKRKGPLKGIMQVAFAHGMTLVGGEETSEPAKKVVVGFDDAGKERVRLGGGEPMKGEGFGWVHGIAACGPGVCVGDTNYKQISAWSVEGKPVGHVRLDTALGLNGFWVHALAEHEGHLLVGLTTWEPSQPKEKTPRVLRVRFPDWK